MIRGLLFIGLLAVCSSASAPPISLESGLGKLLKDRWEKAALLAEIEQSVEDYNADYIARSKSAGEAAKHRRLICLPLDERFDPAPSEFSHKHVQTGTYEGRVEDDARTEELAFYI